jgi:hypothetical protein
MTIALAPVPSTLDRSDPPAATEVRRWARRGVWLLPIFGAITLWATIDHQPSPSDEFAAWSRFVTTGGFLAQHLGGSIVGQAVNLLGVVALVALAVSTGRRVRSAVWGLVLTVFGSVGLLAGFGVAAFAQPAIGHLELDGYAGAHTLYDDVYGLPTYVTLIGGALLFSAASILLALAAGSIDGAPRWARVVYGSSGPLIGLVGVAIGSMQTVGSLAALVGGAGIAMAASRQVSVDGALERGR